MSTNCDAKLELWKSKLLDFSMRNRLLNLSFTRVGGVLRIVEPDEDYVWDRVVGRGLQASFPLRTKKDYEFEKKLYEDECRSHEAEGASLSGLKAPVPFALKEREVLTDLTGKDQTKRLKNLRSRAKNIADERGVNALYLAFGSVVWTDEKRKEHHAPLLLVAVNLTVRSRQSPYVLEALEDPSVNETFALKAKQDFDVTIPELMEDELPSAYAKRVQVAVKTRGWTVEPCLALGIFSFATINMYHDLVENKTTILANKNIQAICGDARRCDSAADIDELVALNEGGSTQLQKEGFLRILDSDSTQDRAIDWANVGASFVLQGPPGTGKSQTIANIIGEALAQGKKVLFVSEKRAALDVVKRRLDAAGLGDWLFVLHDVKGDKKQIIADLARQLDNRNSTGALRETSDDRKYLLTRNQLDAYANDVFEPVQPLNVCAWDAYGELVRLQDAEVITFALDGVAETSAERLDAMREAVEDLSDAAAPFGGKLVRHPWYGLNETRITQDLLSNLRGEIENAVDAARTYEEAYESTTRFFGLSSRLSKAETVKSLVETLKLCAAAKGLRVVPSSFEKPRETAQAIERISAASGQVSERVRALSEAAETVRDQGVVASVEIPYVIDADTLGPLISETEKALEDNSLVEALFREPTLSDSVDKVRQAVLNYRSEQEKILVRFTPEVFSLDCRGMLVRAQQGYTNGLKRFFSSDFKNDVLAITRCERTVSREKLSYEELCSVLGELDSLRSLRMVFDERAADVIKRVPDLKLSIDMDLAILERSEKTSLALHGVLTNARALLRLCQGVGAELKVLRETFGDAYSGVALWAEGFDSARTLLYSLSNLADDLSVPSSQLLNSQVLAAYSPQEFEGLAKHLRSSLDAYLQNRSVILSRFGEDDRIGSLGPDALCARLEKCKSHLSDIESLTDYARRAKRCRELGLSEFVKMAEERELSPDSYVSVFERRFYTLWLEQVTENKPSITDFIEAEQERRIREYEKLDVYELGRANRRIQELLANTISGPELAAQEKILRHEASKSRRIKPIRVLMDEIPELIASLKPCMMMSPLSVSTFLQSRSITFDLVIFDEGSQVCTENAVGAISRGKQVIIGGDSKQLPPTDFFSAAGSNDDELDREEEEAELATDDFDSVLDEASVLPTATLCWHYRSQNESLIAFSNREIYDDELVTFPSSREGVAGEGVSFDYVADGVWEGSRSGNPIEANRVAELVMEHAACRPGRTLGVIAFGSGHADAIEAAISKLRDKHGELDGFFDENEDEPFFVKSLENVQGDERDSIILSVGYARTPKGTLSMNFGPINRSGGERRLNVAVTRAKHDLTLVSSISDTDFTLGPSASRGPELLRDYIAYARRCSRHEAVSTEAGLDGSVARGLRSETPLMDFLTSVIERAGYVAVPNVGETGNRVDIGVKRAPDDEVFLAGIVTDGPTYHAARSTRERERIRPNKLRGMGWRLYNVWAPACARDPKGEAEKLISFLGELSSSDDEEA